ncbi:hypothetical protein G6F50_018130 [Rhizopus delemar]|uniref:Uncharacterized protein n=1 Tax=Rhizopus delemar TaxID=936053 RepID=A0A9P7BZM4_9FUNG|nr:hypothetical protein G6F50_018130 [Rhizopus delemar]
MRACRLRWRASAAACRGSRIAWPIAAPLPRPPASPWRPIATPPTAIWISATPRACRPSSKRAFRARRSRASAAAWT